MAPQLARYILEAGTVYIKFDNGTYEEVAVAALEEELEYCRGREGVWLNNPEVQDAIDAFMNKEKPDQVAELILGFVKRCEETCPVPFVPGGDRLESVLSWLGVGFSETLACVALNEFEV